MDHSSCPFHGKDLLHEVFSLQFSHYPKRRLDYPNTVSFPLLLHFRFSFLSVSSTSLMKWWWRITHLFRRFHPHISNVSSFPPNSLSQTHWSALILRGRIYFGCQQFNSQLINWFQTNFYFPNFALYHYTLSQNIYPSPSLSRELIHQIFSNWEV